MDDEDFDVGAVYKDQVSPLVKQVASICEIYGIPCILIFATKRLPDGGLQTITSVRARQSRLTPELRVLIDALCGNGRAV